MEFAYKHILNSFVNLIQWNKAFLNVLQIAQISFVAALFYFIYILISNATSEVLIMKKCQLTLVGMRIKKNQAET